MDTYQPPSPHLPDLVAVPHDPPAPLLSTVTALAKAPHEQLSNQQHHDFLPMTMIPPPMQTSLTANSTLNYKHPQTPTMTGCAQPNQLSPPTSVRAPLPPPPLPPPMKGKTYPDFGSASSDPQGLNPPVSMHSDDSLIQPMMACSVGGAETQQLDCSSGFQSAGSSWPPATPSSSSSNIAHCECPPPYHPRMQQQQQYTAVAHTSQEQMICSMAQAPQLPDVPLLPTDVVREFEKIMYGENDPIVLTNSVCLLFRFSIDTVRGNEICQAMSKSPKILGRLYDILSEPQFEDDYLVRCCYATGNLTNISKYAEGRRAILEIDLPPAMRKGVRSLINSLRMLDSNVVIFAITAIHNLLLDPRFLEKAKDQIKEGLEHIIQLLNNQALMHNHEFKVIVLDCLQILAHGKPENRLEIQRFGGPALLLKTIRENLDTQRSDELIETASRVLKRLSLCHVNKRDIINNDGVQVLTSCIHNTNYEILKNCLWTLRNLSDVINVEVSDPQCINELAGRLLTILNDYARDDCIITCALGILANLTCNNEPIKNFICKYYGIDLLLRTVAGCPRDGRSFQRIDNEIIEPAVLTLSHLLNQSQNFQLAQEAKVKVQENFQIFKRIKDSGDSITEELDKALNELANRAFSS